MDLGDTPGASDGSTGSDDSLSSSSDYSSSDSSSDSSSSESADDTAPIVKVPPAVARPPAKMPSKIPLATLAAASGTGGGVSGNPGVGIGKPAPTAAAAAPSTGAAAAVRPNDVLFALNAQLSYSHPDNLPIPMPQSLGQHASIIALIDNDRVRFPPRKYRYVDYLATAIQMFVEEVVAEYKKQVESARKGGRDMKKFTWGNKGELAICYALTCDMLKIFYDKLASSAIRPKWEALVEQLIKYLIRKTQIPTDVLTDKTYQTKYLDWKKGGTRYQGEHSNVRFPSAEERQKKLETLIRTGGDYDVQSTVIEAPVALHDPPAATAAQQATATAQRPAEAPKQQPIGQGPAGPGPISARSKAPPSGTAAFKQPHDVKQFHWVSDLNVVKGNPSLMLLPKDRLHMMPFLINMCAKCETPEQFCIITDLISQSPVDVQAAFEAQGGLTFVKQWLVNCMRMKNEVAVRMLAERTASMALKGWGPSTRAAWHNGFVNLDWLRAAEFLGMRPNLWNETVLRLETLARTPLQDDEEKDTTSLEKKRPRETSVADAPPNTRRLAFPPLAVDPALCLPSELQLVPLERCGSLEAASLQALLERRRLFAKEHQTFLEERLRLVQLTPDGGSSSTGQATASSSAASPFTIPLWYNPYALLGISEGEVAQWM